MACMEAFDVEDGTERLESDAPPAHYTVKIQSFSLLAKNNDKYESGTFQAGGYKWKLILYPNGNKTKNVTEHVSVYLSMDETSCLPSGWEVHAVVRIFLLDQNENTYLIVQDAMGRRRRFHWMKLESGLDQFIPLRAFNDSQNGYLVDDTCILGVEVFVSKEMSRGSGESIIMLKDRISHKFIWRINNFSNMDEEYYDSDSFSAGNYDWNIRFYPNGRGSGLGSYISLYLDLVEAGCLPSVQKIFAQFTLRIRDQRNGRHLSGKAAHWFSASNPELGWMRFVSLTSFKYDGPLVNDRCLVEADVSILGFVDPLSGFHQPHEEDPA